MGSSQESLPLFPLELVLLPGEFLPLHIFEERYKRLVARCRESDDPFGIVLRLGDGVAVVGCSARLIAVLEETPDGRSNIVVRGDRPFRIGTITVPEDADREPIVAAIYYLQDEVSDVTEIDGAEWTGGGEAVFDGAPPTRASLNELLERLRVVRDDELMAGEDSSADEDPDRSVDTGDPVRAPRSYRIAADLHLEVALKERLLESRRESERLALLIGYLETLVPRLELVETRREAIRGNGKGD